MIAHEHLTCSYPIAGTDTFRRASRKFLGFYGTNCQNPSATLMQCVVPPPGYIFMQADQAGAESFIVAMEAPRGKFRELHDLNIKVHSYMALQLFTEKFVGAERLAEFRSIAPSELIKKPEWKTLAKAIKEDSRSYDLGKRVVHSANYSIGPKTFQLNCLEMSEGVINLSYQEAKSHLGAHSNLFPEIIQWQAMVRGAAANTRTLRNLFGYPKYFGGRWDNGLERKLYAFVPQSTVGIITALAIIDMSRYIKTHRLPWYILNDKHDSILLAVPNTVEHIDHARIKCREFLGRELVSSHGEHFVMKVGISTGFNWAKFSDNNKNGMKEE